VRIAALTILLHTLTSSRVFAYLDPGSGSMLVTGLVGLLASLLFFLRGLYYNGVSGVMRIFGRGTRTRAKRDSIVLYSEGRQYWSTFRPLIDELIKRNEPCLYLTSDEQDPGLLYSSELVSTKYIGAGTKAYASLAMLEADMCVMTTPGLDVLQIKRSKGVSHYCYLIHAPTDVGTYKRYSFDYFDSVFLSGDHQARSLRHLEKLRGTKEKRLCKVGCLYYDDMQRQLATLPPPAAPGQIVTVLVAPTWGQNGLLQRYRSRILLPLLERGWNVILRPHPQSHVSERPLIDELREHLKGHSNLTWDEDSDPLESMARADVMVSDVSGIIFDFAFLFEKPVIATQFTLNKVGQEAADFPWEPWEMDVLPQVAAQFKDSDLVNLPLMITQEMSQDRRREALRQLRDTSIAHFGRAARYAVDELLRIRSEATPRSSS